MSVRDVSEARPHFHLLDPSREERKRRWLALGFSPLLEAVGLLFLLWCTAALPRPTNTALEKQRVVYLVAPPLASRQLPRRLETPVGARLAPKRIVREPSNLEVRPPVTEQLRVLSIPEVSEVLPRSSPVLTPAFTATLVPERAKAGTDEVRSAKSAGSQPAPLPLQLPMPKVRTGAFGGPDGLPAEAPGRSRRKVAQLGAFDVADGSGPGNGSEQIRGSRRDVVSAGFGDSGSSSSAAGGATGSRLGRVQQGGFGDVVSESHASKAQPPSPTSAFEPVVILLKPKPVYPEEARQLRLEGEVVLSVIFEASGKLRLQRMVRGLGHGMDEAAIQAAEQILFKPARRDGHPVDFEATVRIVFQLAY